MASPPIDHQNLPPFRIGYGYDVHRTSPERKLILGGIHIPEGPGLIGHSDADVLIHAMSDALLGALALPDIGHYFPPGNEETKDMDSREILRSCSKLVSDHGWQIGNFDTTLVAEGPKLLKYRKSMQESLAGVLHISPSQIGIKATTHEKLGALGRGEGISATAVVLLYPA